MRGGLCDKNMRQELDIKSGEAFIGPVKASVLRVPISKWSPPGRSNPFPKKYLKLKEVEVRENRLVRRRSVGNQNDFVEDMCAGAYQEVQVALLKWNG